MKIIVLGNHNKTCDTVVVSNRVDMWGASKVFISLIYHLYIYVSAMP